jgi:hypothetical protein
MPLLGATMMKGNTSPHSWSSRVLAPVSSSSLTAATARSWKSGMTTLRWWSTSDGPLVTKPSW